MIEQTLSNRYSKLFKEYFGDSSTSKFPAIFEINDAVNSLLNGKKYNELYIGETKVKKLCCVLIESKEYPIGPEEKRYLTELDKLLDEAIENHNT